MIIGVGLDIAQVERVEQAWQRHGARFIERCFTKDEADEALARPRPGQALAMRFAAKEAFSKAAGLGMRGLAWREIEVVHDKRGKPSLVLHGRAREWMDDNGATGCHLSLSDDGGIAAAVVILERV
jgi:holo-[acyl-carrier protein] synthase